MFLKGKLMSSNRNILHIVLRQKLSIRDSLLKQIMARFICTVWTKCNKCSRRFHEMLRCVGWKTVFDVPKIPALLAIYQPTRRNIPKDLYLHQHRCGKLKSRQQF